MYRDFTYAEVLASAERAGWRLDDVLGPDDRLDFTRRFMPEALARTDAAPGLDAAERKLLNQISGHQYLSLFGVIEEFILPFVLDHVRPLLAVFSIDRRLLAEVAMTAQPRELDKPLQRDLPPLPARRRPAQRAHEL